MKFAQTRDWPEIPHTDPQAYKAWREAHRSIYREEGFKTHILEYPQAYWQIEDGVECYDQEGRAGYFATFFKELPHNTYPRREFFDARTGESLREVGIGFEPIVYYMSRRDLTLQVTS